MSLAFATLALGADGWLAPSGRSRRLAGRWTLCELEGRLTVVPADAGLSLVGWLPDRMSDAVAAQMARKHTVDVWPLSSFSTRRLSPGLMLGYAGLSDVEIRDGVARVSAALEDADRGAPLTR